jgi:hypothetical protein
VIDRGEGPLWVTHWKSQVSQHAESLRARDLMNQVGIDQKLRLPIGKLRGGV